MELDPDGGTLADEDPGGMLATGLVNWPELIPEPGILRSLPEDWPGVREQPNTHRGLLLGNLGGKSVGESGPIRFARDGNGCRFQYDGNVILPGCWCSMGREAASALENSVTFIHTINAYVDQSTVTITTPFSGSACATSCSGSFLGNPPCSGSPERLATPPRGFCPASASVPGR